MTSKQRKNEWKKYKCCITKRKMWSRNRSAKYLYHLNEEKILKNNVPPGKIVKNGSLYDKSLDVRSVHSTATS